MKLLVDSEPVEGAAEDRALAVGMDGERKRRPWRR